MNRKLTFLVAIALLSASGAPGVRAAELSEKDKALANPYSNDFGPEAVDEAVLKTYPANVQAGYKALIKGCAQCHSAARPLNSRFVEPLDDAALAKLKKDQPELFKDASVWQIETKLWNRYVKRMMNKPGCNIEKKDGKAIWEFLAHDSVARKTGPNAAKWAAHRKGLIEQLKAKDHKRYEELKEAKDL
ncbi:MAG: hypothetical protein AAB036_08125 [Elusimicrobiota bacterium]